MMICRIWQQQHCERCETLLHGDLLTPAAAAAAAFCLLFMQAQGGSGGAMQAAQVSSAVLSDLTVTDCYASVAGGGLSFLGSTNVTLQSSTFFNNSAPLGAGLAADSSQLALQRVNISSNLAVEEEAAEEGGRRRRRLQQAVSLHTTRPGARREAEGSHGAGTRERCSQLCYFC
jgi:hypothetical protein